MSGWSLVRAVHVYCLSPYVRNRNRDSPRAKRSPSSFQMIFQDPSQMMHQLLSTSRPLSTDDDAPWVHDTDFEEKKEKTLAAVLAAKKKIRQEIGELQEKLRTSKDAAAKLKADLARGAAARDDAMGLGDLG